MLDNPSQLFTSGTYMHLGRKAFWLMVLQECGLGFAGIVLAVFMFLFGSTPSGAQFGSGMPINLATAGLLVLALALLFIAVGFFISWLWYITYEFRVSDNAFEIRQGILSKAELAVPYRQIQDVNLDQSLFYRIIGVAVVRILTAGHPDAGVGGETEEILPVLEKDFAEALRSELLRRANVQEVVEAPGQNRSVD